jgi:hypothetical protein
MSFGTYFTVKHGRDFARMVMRVAAQSIAGGDGLRQPEIDVFEQLGSSISVLAEFEEYESMKGVVYGRGYLRRDDPMP